MSFDTSGEIVLGPSSNLFYGYPSRYPNSFRATLSQVSNDMYNALMGAHTSMDGIQMTIEEVRKHAKTGIKLITSASNALIEIMLPRTLESIGRLATESAQFANDTLVRFTQLQDLLGEIIELSATTQSAKEAAIDKMNEQKVNGTREQQRLKENLQMIQNQYQDSKAKLEVARKAYNDAIQLAGASLSPTITESGGNSKPGLHGVVGGWISGFFRMIGCISVNCKAPMYIVDATNSANAMAAAQLAKEDLERAEKRYNEHFLLQIAEQNELAKTISQMALLDVSKPSMDEIFPLLIGASDQIHLMKVQWARMFQFCSKLAIQANSTQQVTDRECPFFFILSESSAGRCQRFRRSHSAGTDR